MRQIIFFITRIALLNTYFTIRETNYNYWDIITIFITKNTTIYKQVTKNYPNRHNIQNLISFYMKWQITVFYHPYCYSKHIFYKTWDRLKLLRRNYNFYHPSTSIYKPITNYHPSRDSRQNLIPFYRKWDKLLFFITRISVLNTYCTRRETDYNYWDIIIIFITQVLTSTNQLWTIT